MENDKFWMVFCPREGCDCATSKVYYTDEEAFIEAKRLVNEDKYTVYVLRSVAKCNIKESPVEWTNID